MTSHQLAHKLLSMPDLLVSSDTGDIGGYDVTRGWVTGVQIEQPDENSPKDSIHIYAIEKEKSAIEPMVLMSLDEPDASGSRFPRKLLAEVEAICVS